MAGEIRESMAALRAARAKMVASMSAEIDKLTQDILATHQDGLDALQLPKAELSAHKAEIQEIRDEFKTLTNGGPAGPLSGSPSDSGSSGPSTQASSAPVPQPLGEPQRSWAGKP